MPSEPLHIFDPRRNFQLQGFAGRATTTTIYDATETGISISGIFQAAEDFAARDTCSRRTPQAGASAGRFRTC
jgi:hypothetical protein